jgi:hypothetical protein
VAQIWIGADNGPYYGKADGFEAVMRLCEAGALGLMGRLDTGPGGD